MKKVVIALLTSVGVVVGGFGLAYAFGTFSPTQQGERQAGAGQAAKLTMQVEAGLADPNSDLLPDSFCSPFNPCPGGALNFSITNNSAFPIRVMGISSGVVTCGDGTSGCATANSNKDINGTFVQHDANGLPVGNGSCAGYVKFVAPFNFDNWPTIPAHSTLQVNGTDNNALGAGMIHLLFDTPNGCQGALFTVALTVQALETTTAPGSNQL